MGQMAGLHFSQSGCERFMSVPSRVPLSYRTVKPLEMPSPCRPQVLGGIGWVSWYCQASATECWSNPECPTFGDTSGIPPKCLIQSL